MIKRSSGVLMPVSSLPSPYGIGTLGQAAYDFIDFLSESGQSWWQILPLGPTGYGDSPYQSLSSFAGNPYLIDLDLLVNQGLLDPAAVSSVDWGSDPSRVDYAKLHENRLSVLKQAYEDGFQRNQSAFSSFRSANAEWLEDYALFAALKRHFGGASWLDWPEEGLRMHEEEACRQWRESHPEEIRLEEYLQFLFFSQLNDLRNYAHEHGIGIIGDLPFYSALDSCDVWAGPEYFQLDEDHIPTAGSGVPPDAFSDIGQYWGNPLYDWQKMKEDGYGWWIRRISGTSRWCDMIRLDHFRGFESFWSIPAGADGAGDGQWVKGPGMDLVHVLKDWFYPLQFIAEDLGYLTEDVQQLLSDSGLPGMKVLEFAFDSREAGNYLPHTYPSDCVCYTGTHDNIPLCGWKNDAASEDVAAAEKYLGLSEEEGFSWGMIRGGSGSVASLFVVQIQDLLELDGASRMNTPGISEGNWCWRMTPGQADGKLAERFALLTELYARSSPLWKERQVSVPSSEKKEA